MRVCVIGYSHAPRVFRLAWAAKGFEITCNPEEQHDLCFISEDMPTDEQGNRDPSAIIRLYRQARGMTGKCIVLTSQVEPGFCRSLQDDNTIYMAETLRISDALDRAVSPDYFFFGLPLIEQALPLEVLAFVQRFEPTPVICGSYEEAEFSKICVNMLLAAQVDRATALHNKLRQIWAKPTTTEMLRWDTIKEALRADRRIGPHAYLTPGRWQDSPHLLRDWVTFQKL